MLMVILVLLILGLTFGSFINAWVDRTKTGKSVLTGRSQCDNCHHILAVYDLIPVISWLMLKGRCRYCHKPIPVQNPMVEIATAILFVFSFTYWPDALVGSADYVYFGLWLVALVYLIALAVYDLKWLVLPDKYIWPLTLVALTGVATYSSSSGTMVPVVQDSMLGLILGFGFFWTLFQTSKGKWIGGGDVKLTLAMGLWLGLAGTVIGLMLAFYVATLVIIPLLILKLVKRSQPIPFGPFLIIGLIIAMLWGQNIYDWYVRFVGL